GLVLGQLLAVKLGVPAAEIEAVGLRQGSVRDRTPEDEARARPLEGLQVVGVVELEGPVARDRDGRRLATSRAGPGDAARAGHRRRAVALDLAPAHGDQRVEVEVLLYQLHQAPPESG